MRIGRVEPSPAAGCSRGPCAQPAELGQQGSAAADAPGILTSVRATLVFLGLRRFRVWASQGEC